MSRVLDDAPFGIYVDHPVGGCLYANQCLLRQFSLSWEDFRGFGWARRVHQEDSAALRDAIEIFERQRDTIDVNYRVTWDSGETRWIHARVSALTGPKGEHLGSLGTTEDVTDHMKFQNRSIELQKLEAVGSLSARVAHDFNNVLGVILGGTSFIATHVDDLQVLQEVKAIEDAVDHASSITRGLLGLAGASRNTGSSELDAELMDLKPLLTRSLGEGIELHLQLGAAGAWVPLDGSELGQVVLNLCLNGRDAMNGQGRLRVWTERERAGVSLSVQDSGAGMSVDMQERIFEPFFTTKPAGRGSGLGLASVRELTERVHGQVRVSSSLGQGTIFRVELPLAQPAAVRRRMRSTSPTASKAKVLLVEDNDALRQTLAYALALQGHSVETAATVERALDLAAQGGFEVFVSDVLLPDGNGVDIYDYLERSLSGRPPFVFMSGFTGEASDRLPQPHPTCAFLTKPFPPQRLVDAVADVMSQVALKPQARA